ncbi:aldo/keto reductase [Halorarum salinum]|uniref:Aldo/keto reductase n=1 Tax=Halorarum salinum TaxID=2743089 RepID=A0A7D5Q7N0_9EURY|nr:aldo/keto reductase [Halobaculum salinum]QLG60317.1 aldo/keto reductase [Halobaculum salinum]
MEYTTLGPTGSEVSKLCLGTWRFGHETDGVVETTESEAHDLLDAAVEAGINFIDTANRYGDPPGTSEQYLGNWLEGRDREDFVIASKVGMPVDDGRGWNRDGLSRKHVRWQIDATLERLGTDYLDLYYIHRLDDRTPVQETLTTLHQLVEEGKVRHLGASTMAAWELTELLWKADANGLESVAVTQPPVDATLQNWQRYERFDLHRYLEVCEKHDIGVLPYSPLAGGFLTGKYERDGDAPEGSRADLDPDTFERKYVSERAWDVLDAVRVVTDEADATAAQVALRWVMEQDQLPGGMIPLTGARTVDQLRENIGAVDLDLSRDQLDRIDEARGQPLFAAKL